jgi:hypothetical protein
MNHPEIYIHPTRVPSEICKAIIESFEYAKTIKPSGFHESGRVFQPLQRKDTAIFIDSIEKPIEFDTLEGLGFALSSDFSGSFPQTVNEHIQEALLSYGEIFESVKTMNIRSISQKLQKTSVGGGYHVWHHEQANIDTAIRVLTWTIYLNDVKEGGETEFLYQGMRVPAEEGKIVLFPASFTHTHRGNPPLSNEKYLVTGWFNLY